MRQRPLSSLIFSEARQGTHRCIACNSKLLVLFSKRVRLDGPFRKYTSRSRCDIVSLKNLPGAVDIDLQGNTNDQIENMCDAGKKRIREHFSRTKVLGIYGDPHCSYRKDSIRRYWSRGRNCWFHWSDSNSGYAAKGTDKLSANLAAYQDEKHL